MAAILKLPPLLEIMQFLNGPIAYIVQLEKLSSFYQISCFYTNLTSFSKICCTIVKDNVKNLESAEALYYNPGAIGKTAEKQAKTHLLEIIQPPFIK